MKQKNNLPDWFRPKKYVHFSKKIRETDFLWVTKKLQNPEFVSNYQFYPLLQYDIRQRKYKKRKKENGSVVRENSKKTEKIRTIAFANHLDAQIYSYYAHEKLTPLYDEILVNCGINENITGYRKIDSGRVNEKTNEIIYKCSIDFAKDVFEYIKPLNDCVAIAFDIKDFFPSLDHNILKKNWCNLLQKDKLPPDYFNIFKSLTQYSIVSEKNLLKVLGISHKRELERKKIDTYCKNTTEFHKKVRNKGLIKKEKKDYGIPQGTPLSAFLSNIYLIEFDKIVHNKVEKEFNGFYRRYSDDIIVVCNKENYKEINEFICNTIKGDDYKLEIQEAKTKIHHFRRNNTGEIKVYEISENEEKINIPLQYLGFEFDGKNIRLKSASLAKYYRGMKALVNLKARRAGLVRDKRVSNIVKREKANQLPKRTMIAKKKRYIDKGIFREQIYKQFSHLGKSNFIKYAERASIIMNEPAIKKQIARHWHNLIAEIKKYKKPESHKYYKEKKKINFDIF